MRRDREWLGSWPQRIGSLLLYGTRDGYDPARISDDERRYRERMERMNYWPRPPYVVRDGSLIDRAMTKRSPRHSR
jgi:hypothetical protein